MADFPLPLPALHDWAVPGHGLRVETIDAHAGGQTLRLILSGVPPLQGRTMQERQDYARQNFDHLRRALLFEPRGHPDMNACILTPPERTGSHFGAIFMHRSGYSPMCGHGIIALTTILLECGLAEMKAPETRLRLDTVAGMIRAYGEVVHDQVERVFFENVPSRVLATAAQVTVPDFGEITYDLAFGGALFAFVDAGRLGLVTSAEAVHSLTAAGLKILQAIHNAGIPASSAPHPPMPLFGVVFTDRPIRRRQGQVDGRQVCIFADGCVDRSPGGMALSAWLALLAQRQLLHENGPGHTVEGITGSTFKGKIIARDETPGTVGLICEIEGQAWITGRHSFLIAVDDPFRGGFLL